MSFIGELKRRNVFRVAIMYLTVGWLSLQATDVLVSLLDLPGWVGKAVIFLLILGFPCALAFSWLYELTPDGLKLDSELSADDTRRQATASRLNLLTIIAAALVVLAILADRLIPGDNEPEPATDLTVALAVLPFANLSTDDDQEDFADGVTEEVLNLLANVRGLRVTSRTSSFSFKGQTADLRTVAAKLGVSYVVEGSVRKAGNRVRVTAQLIEVASDSHVWSQTYEREITNVFAIQSDVAGQIARMLATALSADELSLIGKRPTSSLSAWQNFVSARSVFQGRTTSSDIEKAMSLIDTSIEDDPDFARAYALKAALLLEKVWWDALPQEQQEESMQGAIASARRALALAPELGEPYFTLGLVYSWQGSRDEADESFRKAIARAPNNADGRNWYGSFLIESGYLERGWSEKQLAAELDPLSPLISWQVAFAALTVGKLDVVREFAVKSQENGWPAWQPEAIQGGAALQMKQYDDSERHFTKAFPNAAVDIADAFTAIRAQNINADIRKRLDNLSAYGPPGIARFVVEVGAKDLDGAYATAWSEYNSTSQETHAAGSKRARADWWGQTAADFRSDPRFAELTQSVGLLDFWQKHGWPDLCQPLNETVVCR